MSKLTVLLAALLGCAGTAHAATSTTRICDAPRGAHSQAGRPAGVTGRVAFHAALIDPVSAHPVLSRAVDADRMAPLASAYKTLLLWGVLREVDAGRLRLDQQLETTEANRSIEAYSAGRNTVATLAERTIGRSENTASDILHRAVGPGRLQDAVNTLGACRTTVLMTTKAFWSAQAGLLPDLFPPGTLHASTKAFYALPGAQKATFALRAVSATDRVNADVLLDRLDVYFKGRAYHPDIDLFVQNASTAREFTQLLARVHVQGGLSAASSARLRTILAVGCCRPRQAPFTYRYWGAKAGSGWRLLTLSGFVETTDGRLLAYTYVNDRSDTLHAEDMERQIPTVTRWIASELEWLLRR